MENERKPAFECRDLTMNYGKKTALDHVDLPGSQGMKKTCRNLYRIFTIGRWNAGLYPYISVIINSGRFDNRRFT